MTNISYLINPVYVDKEQLKMLFATVGWHDEITDISKTLQGVLASDLLIVAIDDNTHNVVGMLRTLGDKHISECIDMLCVKPEYRNRGIATKMLEILTEHISAIPFVFVNLGRIGDTMDFFKKKGFRVMEQSGALLLDR